MDKKDIPTLEFKVGKETIKVYKWLTQEEENHYMELLAGDMGVDVEQSEGEAKLSDMKVRATLKNVYEAQKYLMQCYLVEPTYQEYNLMEPSLRQKIFSKIEAQHNKKK